MLFLSSCIIFNFTKHSIKVISYNCKNVRTSVNEIQTLCKRCDILLLQETWLLDGDLSYLSFLSDKFYAKGISSMNTSQDIIQGRPYGGIAILWRKELSHSYNIIEFDERLMVLNLKCNSIEILVCNIYMPCSCDSNLDDFMFYLSKMDSIVAESNTTHVYIMGDFNADVGREINGSVKHKFGKALSTFCDLEEYVISDVLMLDNNSYTFYSESHDTLSWLDHVVCTTNSHKLIVQVDILYDYVSSDHHPLLVEINCDLSCDVVFGDNGTMQRKKIQWGDLSSEKNSRYTFNTEQTLSQIKLNHELLLCDDIMCNNDYHKLAISHMYNDIVDALVTSSQEITNSSKDNFKQVLGWNDYCKAAHSEARTSYLLWRNNGKPKYGYIFEEMKRSRAYFKFIIKKCKRDCDIKSANVLASKLLNKDENAFWKEIKKMNNCNLPLANCIDGVTGSINIANQWCTHFSDILNSANDVTSKQYVLNELNDVKKLSFNRFTSSEVSKVITQLKAGKSCGKDSLYGEHFKYAHNKINVMLALVFNCIVIHGFLPESIMDTLIRPLVKDKKGNLSQSDNYRPLAITCIASKAIELLILGRYEVLLKTTDNQFGFKSKHSTDLCVYSLKHVIEYYKSLNSAVFLCYLDASKAFDKVNNWKLFEKLINKNIPYVIVRLLMVWYSTQRFYVSWGNALSNSFKVTNGVRQGGILSPILFNMFIDELSVSLNAANIGCHINSLPVNHLFYADDSVLIAPSPQALQNLIRTCELYAKKFELTYNAKKSVCMAVLPKWLKNMSIPGIYLNDKLIKFKADHKYLGMIITDNSCDDLDIYQQVKATYARGNTLISRFRQCEDNVKIKLFKSFCSNFYGCNLWVHYHKCAINKIVSAYGKMFRLFFNISDKILTRQCMLQCTIDHAEVLMRKLSNNFYNRLLSSKNNIVKEIVQSVFFLLIAIFLNCGNIYYSKYY